MLEMVQGSLEQSVAALAAGAFEGTGIPWPGGVLIAAAAMAAGGGWLTLVVLASVFSMGYTAGALAQYAAGRLMGPVALAWLPAAQRVQLKAAMARYGQAACLLTRPLAIGNYVSLPAGMMRLPLGRFLVFTFLGIWPWAFGTMLAGRLLGSRLALVQELAARYTLPAVAAAAVLTLGLVGWTWVRGRNRRVAVPG